MFQQYGLLSPVYMIHQDCSVECRGCGPDACLQEGISHYCSLPAGVLPRSVAGG